MSKGKVSVALLSLSALGFASWQASEGWTASPVIPTAGDVPTIGHGSTRYEDGTPVRMTDPPITRERAEQLARNLNSGEEQRFIKSLPGVKMSQAEFDLYMDFVGNFGMGNWRKSSMRAHLLAGEHLKACEVLPQWRMQGGRDCALPANWGPRGCRGVWLRSIERFDKCMAAQ